MIESNKLKNTIAELQEKSDKTPTEKIAAPTANLNNKPWVKLLEENASIIKSVRERIKRTEGGEALKNPVDYLESIVLDLLMAMEHSGTDTIDGEQVFSILRHKPVPSRLAIPDNTRITTTLEPGIAVEDRVFVQARVTLE